MLDFVFKSLIGISPNVTGEEYEQGAWYESNTSYFGTKWDVSYDECQFEFGEEEIRLMPPTAWSPPVQFAVNLCVMYGVSVEMTYDESGCDFYGKSFIDNEGNLTEEDYRYNEGAYHFDNGYFWESVIQNDMEYAMEEEKGVDEFVNEYPYLTDKEKEELRKLYTDFLTENKTENNGELEN